MSGAGDRLPEVAGAEQGDVVLAGGAEDLADLLDQRLDVVADPRLPELAEAREVAADLRRVDVGVVGELLGGDRVLAHLPSLGQDLEVAREPRRNPERESIPVREVRGPCCSAVSAATSSIMRTRYRALRAARPRPEELGDDLAVELHNRDAFEEAGVAARRRSRCRPLRARNRARLLEVAPAPLAPRRRGGSQAARTA